MIQEKAVCFGCEGVIETLSEIVFAPPFEDESHRKVSACFHGLCLMKWRERRAEVRAMLQSAHQAFLRHITGECGCDS